MSYEISHPDVVIIGAGMAGLAIANTLTRSGAKVVCLEQGPYVQDIDSPMLSPDWEFAMRRDWAFNPNVRNSPFDFPVTTNGTFQPYLFNAVGGSTNQFSAFWHRQKPVDFRKGTEHGLEGAIDWPIAYEDLEPFYDRTDAEIGIAGLRGDPAYPPRDQALRLPQVTHGSYARIVAAGMDRLGVHWWPGDNAILTQEREGRLACNNCGMCNLGCPRHARGNAHAVYLQSALVQGMDLRHGCRVSSILTDATGAACGVEYIELGTGAERAVRAPLVVLSASGIGSPRTLLMSSSKAHPDGIGNAHGNVGRYFMTHGYRLADLWFDCSTEHYKGPFGAGPYCQEWYDSDPSRGFVNGVTITFGGAWGPVFSALGATTGQRPARWGQHHHKDFEDRFDRHIFAAIQADDLPVATNRVTLDPVLTDSTGLPAAHVNYDLHPNTRALLEFGGERLKEIADASGAVALDLQPMDERFSQPGWHLMGTARMSATAEEGVVDKWNRVWDTPGLVVCDGSSMTSGGAGNPTSTIVALASRCADFLVKSMGSQVRAGSDD